MNKNRVAHINQVFLATLLAYILGVYLLSLVEEVCNISLPTYARIIYSQLILVLPAVIYLWVNRIKPMEFIRCKKVSIKTVILLVLLGIFIRPFMTLLSAISMIFSENLIADTATQLMSEVNFPLALLFIAVIPSILEEFVYRGVFYNEYRKINNGKAILLSGLLFGLMHMNLNQFIYAFFMGAMFALVIEATDSIVASMIVHFTINGSSLFLMQIKSWVEQKVGNAALVDSTTMNSKTVLKLLPSLVFPALFALGISVLIYYGIAVHNKRLDCIKQLFVKSISKEKTDRLLTTPLVAGIIICLIIMISSIF